MTLSGLSGLAKFIFNDLEHCAVSLRQLSFLLHFAGDIVGGFVFSRVRWFVC